MEEGKKMLRGGVAARTDVAGRTSTVSLPCFNVFEASDSSTVNTWALIAEALPVLSINRVRK